MVTTHVQSAQRLAVRPTKRLMDGFAGLQRPHAPQVGRSIKIGQQLLQTLVTVVAGRVWINSRQGILVLAALVQLGSTRFLTIPGRLVSRQMALAPRYVHGTEIVYRAHLLVVQARATRTSLKSAAFSRSAPTGLSQ